MTPVINPHNDQEKRTALAAVYALLLAKAKERRARLEAAYDVILTWPEPAQDAPETAVNGRSASEGA